ncbi:MAG TPA: hypothetical protein VFJ55_03595 [Chthoniobacterales bacterium]|nr:hypothetical protein [Chthoniobacterales bacterium]
MKRENYAGAAKVAQGSACFLGGVQILFLGSAGCQPAVAGSLPATFSTNM